MCGHRAFGLELAFGTADALLADFTDVFVARFVGFACFDALFRKLNHDELAVPASLGVELYDRMGSSGRAREEIKDLRGSAVFYSRASAVLILVIRLSLAGSTAFGTYPSKTAVGDTIKKVWND